MVFSLFLDIIKLTPLHCSWNDEAPMSPKTIDLLAQVYRMFSWILENKNLSHIFRLTSFLFRSRGQVSSHELNIKDNVLLLLFGEDT